MPETMTLAQKLRAARRSPKSWDIDGLLEDAADQLEQCVKLDSDEYADLMKRRASEADESTTARREVVPGWTVEEILAREA